jgi:AcrR family transcriptional regulator
MPRPANPELVDRIVRVTAEMLEEKGIEGVTMRGVAERVGSSPTIIYHYYKNKDGLLHSAVSIGLAWFGQAVAAADKGGSGVERLRAGARAYVEWGIRNPAMYRLMYEQRLPRPAEGDELTERRRGLAEARDLLADIFAHEHAERPPKDLDTAANLMFTGQHGIVSASISGRLWGPQAGQDEQLLLSLPLADALVADRAAAWGMAP